MFEDESEIEDWYEEQKTALDKKFYNTSLKGSLEDGREEYRKKLRALVDRYEKEQALLVKRRERQKKLQAPKLALKTFFHNKKTGLKKLYNKKKKDCKKWWFEFRFKRMYP